jgi:two-component system phosphate regulon response regulator PhoB
MIQKPRILVVEDDINLLELIRYNLDAAEFETVPCMDGEEALLLVEEQKPDLILLDWMLPGLPGIEVCRRVRRLPEAGNVPVVMLTARTDEADRLRGFDTGADDYLTKPFSPKELVARIRAVLRRMRPALSGATLEFAGVAMDTVSMKVTRDGRGVPLGPTEFRLLRHFLEHPGRVFSREQLLDAVWGREVYIENRTVDVHIRRLRKAINLDDTLPDVIRTVRSAGYAIDEAL